LKENLRLQEEDNLISDGIEKKGLRKDIYSRVKKLSKNGAIKECIEEVQSKLYYLKDYDSLRENMSTFYQSKLSKIFL
jgi:hypothetical protein